MTENWIKWWPLSPILIARKTQVVQVVNNCGRVAGHEDQVIETLTGPKSLDNVLVQAGTRRVNDSDDFSLPRKRFHLLVQAIFDL